VTGKAPKKCNIRRESRQTTKKWRVRGGNGCHSAKRGRGEGSVNDLPDKRNSRHVPQKHEKGPRTSWSKRGGTHRSLFQGQSLPPGENEGERASPRGATMAPKSPKTATADTSSFGQHQKQNEYKLKRRNSCEKSSIPQRSCRKQLAKKKAGKT